ncbi:MAG: TIM barrel protein [Acidobacteria bacterium]|nr:TIM barrel protein [Acidobacteriota bacterium]
MKRRDFLVGAAAGAAAVAGVGPAFAQAPAQGRGQGAAPAGGGGRGQGPAQVPASKLARISLMQLNWNPYLKPTNPNATPTPDQTLTVFDLPKLYVEMYGIRSIEYQHGNIVQSETDPAFRKELKAKLDEAGVQMTQINLEFGTTQAISNPEPANRQAAVDHVKQWMDIAAEYGCPRVMINQQQAQLTKDVRAGAVQAFKAMADYGRTKNVKVSVETRGANPPMVNGQPQELGMKPWEFMVGIIEEAGANSNVDIGNVGAMNQQELHDCIRRWLPTSSGNMHIKASPYWSFGTAIRYTESLGYKGLYAIEVTTHQGMRVVYNEILANLA